MARRLAFATLCLAALLPAAWRTHARTRAAAPACPPAGRGTPPRHWIGCVADPGPERDLSGHERLLAGVAIDLDTATPEDLASVPGLSPRLAIEVVRDRTVRGRFAGVEDLIRVRGIGPVRLERARSFLATGP